MGIFYSTTTTPPSTTTITVVTFSFQHLHIVYSIGQFHGEINKIHGCVEIGTEWWALQVGLHDYDSRCFHADNAK
jgi:hypothetical protein